MANLELLESPILKIYYSAEEGQYIDKEKPL